MIILFNIVFVAIPFVVFYMFGNWYVKAFIAHRKIMNIMTENDYFMCDILERASADNNYVESKLLALDWEFYYAGVDQINYLETVFN